MGEWDGEVKGTKWVQVKGSCEENVSGFEGKSKRKKKVDTSEGKLCERS